jgi:uncharacterized protein YyaL (SSP411 family)
MLKSLILYAGYLGRSVLLPERRIMLADLRRYTFNTQVYRQQRQYRADEKRRALDQAVSWLLCSQKSTGDGGMGSYHITGGWTTSYPETTGYIIPTLIRYAGNAGRSDVIDAAMAASRFLLSIQKPSGGWQGGRMADNRPEIVFNTGQVIRGMIAAFRQTGDAQFLEAASRAGDWLCAAQSPEGYWKKSALMEQARVYDTFVDAPLLELASLTGREKYSRAARSNLDWVIREKMLENGWFSDCDNTIRRNARPILHTIAYTLDGLIDCSELTSDHDYAQAAITGAAELRRLFLANGFLNGRYDRNWNGSEHFICTGGAQMAIVWLKLYRMTGENSYLIAATRMISLLIFIQDRYPAQNPATLGAIPGSFPVWGRYEPFAFPNWATKFFCDAVMLEEEVSRGKR